MHKNLSILIIIPSLKQEFYLSNNIIFIHTQSRETIKKTITPRDEITSDTYKLGIPKSDVHDFYRNICAAIDGEKEQLIKPRESFRVLKTMKAAFASVDAGPVITLDEGN